MVLIFSLMKTKYRTLPKLEKLAGTLQSALAKWSFEFTPYEYWDSTKWEFDDLAQEYYELCRNNIEQTGARLLPADVNFLAAFTTGDGNCLYNSIAELVKKSNEEWVRELKVRNLIELIINFTYYKNTYADIDDNLKQYITEVMMFLDARSEPWDSFGLCNVLDCSIRSIHPILDAMSERGEAGNTQPLQMNHVFHPRRPARNITINILWCSGMSVDIRRAQVQMGMRTEFWAPTHFVPLSIDPFDDISAQRVESERDDLRRFRDIESRFGDDDNSGNKENDFNLEKNAQLARTSVQKKKIRREQKAVRRKSKASNRLIRRLTFDIKAFIQYDPYLKDATLETRLNINVKKIKLRLHATAAAADRQHKKSHSKRMSCFGNDQITFLLPVLTKRTPDSATDARDYVFNPNKDKPDLLVAPTASLVKHLTPGSTDHIKINNILLTLSIMPMPNEHSSSVSASHWAYLLPLH
ncbi:unnamed protein product [Didymodactylos carnosus]|uniref:OTU domain-containing protein n=1 Tax=Didymodactylos carnosus TaxID=1234261 RepID=A0A815UT16_9BILA|nr:unnamed protein product [Didymodactylos carnosus]CAF4383112.1 unnamed protein product [Didymodactylos carnosus]